MTGSPTRSEGLRHGRSLSLRSWTVVAALAILVALSLAAAVSMLENQKPVAKHGGCPFPDGISYCNMARGALGRHPYSYRPLVPLAARATRAVTGLQLVAGFRVVAVAGVPSRGASPPVVRCSAFPFSTLKRSFSRQEPTRSGIKSRRPAKPSAN